MGALSNGGDGGGGGWRVVSQFYLECRYRSPHFMMALKFRDNNPIYNPYSFRRLSEIEKIESIRAGLNAHFGSGNDKI